jgi:hypothetical protein
MMKDEVRRPEDLRLRTKKFALAVIRLTIVKNTKDR